MSTSTCAREPTGGVRLRILFDKWLEDGGWSVGEGLEVFKRRVVQRRTSTAPAEDLVYHLSNSLRVHFF